MSENHRYIADIDALEESGQGVCFTLEQADGIHVPAFAVKYEGQCYAYINRCGHIAVRLDYLPGQFFSDDGRTLICSTHGAEYAPQTGACLGGPCYGVGLEPLHTVALEGKLYLNDSTLRVFEKPQPNT